MRTLVRENIIKNSILALALALAYPRIYQFFSQTAAATDKSVAGDLLVALSILAVTACFGNFAFTYEKMGSLKLPSRLLAHATTGLLMLIIGLALEMSAILTQFLVGRFLLINACWALLYVASVLYDFWDLLRFRDLGAES